MNVQSFREFVMKRTFYREKLTQNSITYFISKAFPAVFQLFNILFLASIMPSSNYGQYGSYFAISLLFVQFFSAWLSQSILRYSSSKVEYKAFNSSEEIFGVLGIYSAFTASILLLFLSLLIGLSTIEALPFCVFVFTEILFQILYSSFQSKEMVSKVFIIEGLKSIFSIIFLVLAKFTQQEITFYLPVFAIAIANTICILFFLNSFGVAQQSFRSVLTRITKDISYVKSYLLFGGSMTLFSTFSLMTIYFDRIIMPVFIQKSDIGIYIVIYDLSSKLIGFILAPILLASHPILAKNWNEKNAIEFKSVKNKALFMQFTLGMFSILIFYLTSDILFGFFQEYKNPYSNKIIFLIIALAGLVVQMNQILHKNLEFSGKTSIMILGALISLIVNVLGNLIFLSRYGILAASVMSLISAIVYSIIVVTRKESR